MPLSSRVVLALTAVNKLVLLAEGAGAAGVGGAGETISQQAAAAGKSAGGRHALPKKVASAQGAAFYKLPIGALIIPHQHFIKGQPSHWSGNIAQAKWVANEWKDRGEADQAAHHAVEEAHTHHWEQVGDKEFAVHNGLKTYVSKHTDLDKPDEVKKTPKVFVKPGEDGKPSEHIYIHPDSHTAPGEVQHTNETSQKTLAQHYKELPQHAPQKSVSFAGKHAAWVPADWKVYKSPAPEDDLYGKFAKDPEGNWHMVGKDGKVTPAGELNTSSHPDAWLKNGVIGPDDDHPEDHGTLPAKEGAQPAKQEVGGVHVSKQEMQDAVDILNKDKSTAVKQPLAKAGHPLKDMDYHGVSKAELKKHPELKVSAGTKKEHVGQVKLAVLHHLANKIKRFANSDADAAHADQVADSAKAEAEHAQELTPHTVTFPKMGEDKKAHLIEPPENPKPNPEFGKNSLKPVAEKHYLENPPAFPGGTTFGVPKAGGGDIEVAKEDVQAAIEALNASKSTAIKQILKAKGSKLQDVDYWAVIHAYQAAHPNGPKGTGTKQVHAPNAKMNFIAALQEKADGLGKLDQATGHDDSAALYDLIKGSQVKNDVLQGGVSGAVAMALKKAVLTGNTYYAWVDVYGEGAAATVPPSTKPFYGVTPQLKVIAFTSLNPEGKAVPDSWVQDTAKKWLEPKKAEPSLKEKVAAQAAAAPKPKFSFKSEAEKAADVGKAWQAAPGWKDLHQFMRDINANADVLYTAEESGAGYSKHLPRILWRAYALEEPQYLTVKDGKWVLAKEAPLPGTLESAAQPFFTALPDHQLIHTSAHGLTMPFSETPGALFAYAKGQVKELPEPAPEHPGTFPVKVKLHIYHAPNGSAVFLNKDKSTAYVRHPDGSWAAVDAFLGVEQIPSSNWKSLDDWAVAGHKDVTQVNKAARLFAAPSQVAESVTPDPAPPSEPDVILKQGGKEYALPAGTQVWVYKGDNFSKFAKKPDGTWWYPYKGNLIQGPSVSAWDKNITGSSQYKLEGAVKEEAPEEEPKPDAGIPAIYSGQIVGEWPAGTKLYHKAVGSYQGTYGKAPDGKWYKVSSGGVSPAGTYMVTDDLLSQQNALEPEEPPTAQQIADAKTVGELLKLIKTGSVKYPDGFASGSNPKFKSWQQALLFGLATKKTGQDVSVMPAPGGGFVLGTSTYDGYWKISHNDLSVRYYPPSGASQEVPLAQLAEAAHRYVVPESVVIAGKQYKFGYWKKAKGGAFLNIKPAPGYVNPWKYGTAAHAEYWYTGSNGTTKEFTPKAAATYLETGGPEHFTENPLLTAEKAVTAKVHKASYATVAGPGTYSLYSGSKHGPHPTDVLDLKADGSGVYTADSGPNVIPQTTVGMMLAGGMVLDHHGNTVVLPGHPVNEYHLFGGAGHSKAELEQFRDKLAAHLGQAYPGPEWLTDTAKFLNDAEHQNAALSVYPHMNLMKEFMLVANHGNPGSSQQQVYAIHALAKELLAIPELPEGAKLAADGGVKEPVFLKSLPEGISKAADLFTFTKSANALPYSGEIPTALHSFTTGDLKFHIQNVSQQFGKGLVVGTHLSGLSKQQLVDWLQAWEAGDMAKVFALDAEGGKVSPAHPGAPANLATHHITWSPADSDQVPAQKDIEGDWTKLEYGALLPAEVDNYLIKMGFKHAEYLYPSEREQVVRAHREHDQKRVDTYTHLAEQRFSGGQGTKSQVPEWTDGLKASLPYDPFLKGGKPASEWTTGAVSALIADHHGEMLKYAQQFADENGYSSAESLLSTGTGYNKAAIVQLWLDDEHAKQVAEQMVPVWAKVDTGALPSHGHPVWKAVKTIPYTGEKTTYFVKPAPDGKTFRLEQEHAANLLGKLFGFKSAESSLVKGPELGPAFGKDLLQAQKAVPGEALGHYTDMPAWSQFTPQMVTDIALEHLLDRVLFNDDTSANNMIKTPDGHLVGIDKGRSWGDFGWKALAGDKGMDSMTQLVYTKLYAAIKSGEISKEVADQAYVAMIQKARKMQAVPDAKVRQLLEAAFAHRTKWTGIGSKEAAIQKVLDAKNSLEHDFHGMWAKLYEDAGFGKEASDFGKGKPWGDVPLNNPRYGMVVFNDKGEVFLREVKGHYGETAWSFSKGGANKGENPLQAAVRESSEELSWKFKPVDYVPGAFTGKQSTSYFFLATAKDGVHTPELDNGETEQAKWVSLEEAKKLIGTSESAVVVKRDLAILDAASKAWTKAHYDKEPFDPYALGSPLPDVPTQKIPDSPAGHKIFSGFSEPEFTDHVGASKVHGTPAFFGGTELKDMHALVYRTQDSAGKDVTAGEMHVRGSAYKKMVDWLKARSGKAIAPEDDTATTYPGSENLPGPAPASSPDRGSITGERGYYNAIIKAARTVSRHKSDGQYNTGVLSAMDDVAKKMDQLKGQANTVLASAVPGSDKEFQYKNISAMADHYLGLIGQVRQAKEGAYGFAPGDLPRWLALKKPDAPQLPKPEDELAQLGIKLSFGHSSYATAGKLDEATHDFKGSGSSYHYNGQYWVMELPDGERIEFGNGKEHGVELVNHGRVRWSSPDHSAASLERVRAAMQLTGLEMREAEHEDFEKFYWRHMLSMLGDRSDGHQGPQQKVWDSLKESFAQHGLTWAYGTGDGHRQEITDDLMQLGETNPEAEVAAYRKAFATLTSQAQVDDWGERGGFLPQLKHFDPNHQDVVGGKPDWYRFDLAPKIKDLPMPVHQTSSGDSFAKRVIRQGGAYALNAVRRVIAPNASSNLGNPDESGGPAYYFTRLNQKGAVYFTPKALARSHNYSFSDDSFGRWYERKSGSSWNPATWSKYTGSKNETMISDALSFLDDVEIIDAQSSSSRLELIKWLKDRGITHIRYLPVEDRIVGEDYGGGISASHLAKIRDNWKAHPELLDPLYSPEQAGSYVAPSLAPAAQVPAETAAETAAADTGASAAAAEQHGFPQGVKDNIDKIVSSLADSKDVKIYVDPEATGDVESTGDSEPYYVQDAKGIFYYHDNGEGHLDGPHPLGVLGSESVHSKLAKGTLVNAWSSPVSWKQQGFGGGDWTAKIGNDSYAALKDGDGVSLYKNGTFAKYYGSIDEAKAAAEGKTPLGPPATPGSDPHVSFIKKLLTGTAKFPEGTKIYHSSPDSVMYYVKFPSGQWVSFEAMNDGSTVGPEPETMTSFIQNLNQAAADGSMIEVYGGEAKATGEAAAAPSATEWTAAPSGSKWTAKVGSAKFQIMHVGDQYDVYHDGGYQGAFDSLEEAKASAESAQKWTDQGGGQWFATINGKTYGVVKTSGGYDLYEDGDQVGTYGTLGNAQQDALAISNGEPAEGEEPF